MPPAIRPPDLFMIPQSPYISWASIMIAALIVIDVSTEIGEYHRAVRRSAKWGQGSADAQRRVCNVIDLAAMQTVAAGMTLIVISAAVVTRLTSGMDNRMVIVLEGISRLEAAYLVRALCYCTPFFT